jgi:hypothetical protein
LISISRAVVRANEASTRRAFMVDDMTEN